jgi:hypothetical protein
MASTLGVLAAVQLRAAPLLLGDMWLAVASVASLLLFVACYQVQRLQFD